MSWHGEILFPFNPPILKNDQHQFSPNKINTYIKEKVMRIFEMIAKKNMQSTFCQVMIMIEFFYQLFGDQSENLRLDICHFRALLRPFART